MEGGLLDSGEAKGSRSVNVEDAVLGLVPEA